MEMLLGVISEMVLTGLADGTLEVGCAHFAGRVTETGTHTDEMCFIEHCRCHLSVHYLKSEEHSTNEARVFNFLLCIQLLSGYTTWL